MRKIGLRPLSRRMHLLKDHLLGLAIERFPPGNMPLQGAHLRGAVAPWMSLAQKLKESRALQGGITFQLLHHPGPVLLKWVHAGLPIMWAFELAVYYL